MCYSLLQCITICFNMLHCVTFCYNMLQHVTTGITMHHCTNRLVPPMAFVENPGRQWPSASNGETKCTLCPKIQECKEIHTNLKTREYKNTLKTKKQKWVDSNELQLRCTTSQTLPEASLTWKLFYDWSTVDGGDNNIK